MRWLLILLFAVAAPSRGSAAGAPEFGASLGFGLAHSSHDGLASVTPSNIAGAALELAIPVDAGDLMFSYESASSGTSGPGAVPCVEGYRWESRWPEASQALLVGLRRSWGSNLRAFAQASVGPGLVRVSGDWDRACVALVPAVGIRYLRPPSPFSLTLSLRGDFAGARGLWLGGGTVQLGFALKNGS